MNNHFYIPQETSVTSVIQSAWQVDQVSLFASEYIIPKGVVEIIFNFSGNTPIQAAVGSTSVHLPDCFINGFNTKPIQIQLPGRQVFFGVVLQPLATRKIFGTAAGEFSNTTIDVSLLDAGFKSLWHRLAEKEGFDERVAVLHDWVKTNHIAWQPREQRINDFLYAADTHDTTVNGLAGALCYSPRQVTRKIFEATGMNTEELLLYKKYLHAVRLIHTTDMPLTAIAYHSQFSDQSHFIKSFKSYANMTPGAYRRDKSRVMGHLYKNVR